MAYYTKSDSRRFEAASTSAKRERPCASIATTPRKSATSRCQTASAAPNSLRSETPADAVKKVAGVSMLKEFGAAEAVWHLDVVDFRGVVAMDARGNSLFDTVRQTSEKRLWSLHTKH